MPVEFGVGQGSHTVTVDTRAFTRARRLPLNEIAIIDEHGNFVRSMQLVPPEPVQLTHIAPPNGHNLNLNGVIAPQDAQRLIADPHQALRAGNGVLLPESASGAPNPNGIHVPNIGIKKPTPEQVTQAVTMRDDEADNREQQAERERIQAQFERDRQHARQRPANFIAIALWKQFVRQQQSPPEIYAQFIQNLMVQDGQYSIPSDQNFSPEALRAERIGSTLGIGYWTPPLEGFMVRLLHTSRDDYLTSLGELPEFLHAGSMLLRNYRVMNGVEHAHMNWLREQLVQTLGTLQTDPDSRRAIYDMLGQLHVPIAMQERILWRIEEFGDYANNPLASAYGLNMYKRRPESTWVQAQTERQKTLNWLLERPARQVYRDYPQLARLATRIVFSQNPLELPDGKIGFEYEGGRGFRTNDTVHTSVKRRGEIELIHSRFRRLTAQWFLGKDGGGQPEIRKNDSSLSFSDYTDALVELYAWITDHFQGERNKPQQSHSMHIHFDINRHAEPTLAGLFDTYENTHGTWEQRNIMPFRSPSEILAFIALSIHDADTHAYPEANGKLPVTHTTSWQELLFGHIVTNITDPQARAAALVALRDPVAMRGFEIEPLLHTFPRSLLNHIGRNPEDFVIPYTDHEVDFHAERSAENLPLDLSRLRDLLINYRGDNGCYVVGVFPETRRGRQVLAEVLFDPAVQLKDEAVTSIIYIIGNDRQYQPQLFSLLSEDLGKPIPHGAREKIVNKLVSNPEYHDRLVQLITNPESDISDVGEDTTGRMLHALARNPKYDYVLWGIVTGQNAPFTFAYEVASEILMRNASNDERLAGLLFQERPASFPPSVWRDLTGDIITALLKRPQANLPRLFALLIGDTQTNNKVDRLEIISVLLKEPSYYTQLFGLLDSTDLKDQVSGEEALRMARGVFNSIIINPGLFRYDPTYRAEIIAELTEFVNNPPPPRNITRREFVRLAHAAAALRMADIL